MDEFDREIKIYYPVKYQFAVIGRASQGSIPLDRHDHKAHKLKCCNLVWLDLGTPRIPITVFQICRDHKN